MSPEELKGVIDGVRGRVNGCGPAHVFAMVGSTQDEASRLAARGAPAGTVVVALEQTDGRGRSTRRWESPAGLGVYLSAVLRPVADPGRWPALSVIAGTGLAEGLSAAGMGGVSLKWPNDCLIQGQKAAGILAEAFPDAGYVVLGIGLNVEAGVDVLPPEVLIRSTDLSSHMNSRARTFDACVSGLSGALDACLNGPRSLVVDREAANGLLWTRGEVTVGEHVGKVVGIDGNGALVLDTGYGNTTVVTTGEVNDAGCN